MSIKSKRLGGGGHLAMKNRLSYSVGLKGGGLQGRSQRIDSIEHEFWEEGKIIKRNKICPW